LGATSSSTGLYGALLSSSKVPHGSTRLWKPPHGSARLYRPPTRL